MDELIVLKSLINFDGCRARISPRKLMAIKNNSRRDMRHPPGRKWLKDLRACLCLIACLLAWNPSAARSQDEERAEYTLKLAFLYNFTKFVEWPADTYPDAGSPLAICIVGEDPFNPDMEADLRTRTSGIRSMCEPCIRTIC